VYGSTVVPQVRHRCLATLAKLLYFSTPDMLATGADPKLLDGDGFWGRLPLCALVG
jgi:hypothetical protein